MIAAERLIVEDGTMTIEELIAERDDLLAEVALIDADLTEARQAAYEDGRYADRTWYRQTTLTLKAKRRRLQKLQEQMGELRRAQRIENWYANKAGSNGTPSASQITKKQARIARSARIEAAFVDAAKARLSPETFEAILQDAKDQVGTEDDPPMTPLPPARIDTEDIP